MLHFENMHRMAEIKPENEGMKDLVAMVNKVQDLLTPLNLNFSVQLPQIAVVGAQSVGKSSVLESIVGREFIPRGKDVVTRRPLIIQLINANKEHGIFLHKPKVLFTDFKEICKEIENETERESGKYNVSTKPINLKIFSPNVINLTLVDLPGLTKVPVGDQPHNIDEIIYKMVKDFIQSDSCLILAVSSASQDIATSDALKIAREVDPEGARTIGVLTHLDLMSPGTNACAVLQNRVFSLKRGYVGVINRSQDDINSNRDITYAVQKEREFFTKMKCYRDMADKMGIKYLQSLLNKQLKYHIKEKLPSIRENLYQNLTKLKLELGTYEELYDDTDSSRIGFIVQLVNKFIEHFKISLLGYNENVNLDSVSIGNQINKALYNEVTTKMKIDVSINEENIIKAIHNNNAIRTGLLLPQLAFDCVCKDVIERYKRPLSEAVGYITNLMFQAVELSASLLQAYPRLKDEVIFKVKNIISSQEEIAKKHLVDHIDAELSFLNVRHPYFNYKFVITQNKPTPIKSSRSRTKLTSLGKCEKEDEEFLHISDSKFYQMPEFLNQQNSYEDEQINKLGELASSYLQIVEVNIEDIVVKYIVYYLVKKSILYTSTNLISELVANQNPSLFLEEYSIQSIKRKELKEKIKVLETSLRIISEI